MLIYIKFKVFSVLSVCSSIRVSCDRMRQIKFILGEQLSVISLMKLDDVRSAHILSDMNHCFGDTKISFVIASYLRNNDGSIHNNRVSLLFWRAMGKTRVCRNLFTFFDRSQTRSQTTGLLPPRPRPGKRAGVESSAASPALLAWRT